MAGSDALGAEIASLRDLDLPALRRRWRVVFGKKAPEHLSRSLLQRILAYRVQAQALGDLDRETVRFLDRLAKEKGSGPIPVPEQRSMKPGTLLVREWEGTVQRVTVLEEGIAWNGATYRSLSEVARAITGTNWNGPRFFGLRTRKRVGAAP
jgi:hypothetical protein